MIPTKRKPSTPGHLLKVFYLDPLKKAGWTYERFAEHIGIDRVRLSGIINGRRAVTADTAIRLSKALGTTPQMWMNAQSTYELATADNIKGIRKIRMPQITTDSNDIPG